MHPEAHNHHPIPPPHYSTTLLRSTKLHHLFYFTVLGAWHDSFPELIYGAFEPLVCTAYTFWIAGIVKVHALSSFINKFRETLEISSKYIEIILQGVRSSPFCHLGPHHLAQNVFITKIKTIQKYTRKNVSTKLRLNLRLKM